MKLVGEVFGSGQDLAMLQMSIRAVVVFFMALIMVRISGRRTFGKRTAFDNTLVIILGAVLSRAIVGASPFGQPYEQLFAGGFAPLTGLCLYKK